MQLRMNKRLNNFLIYNLSYFHEILQLDSITCNYIKCNSIRHNVLSDIFVINGESPEYLFLNVFECYDWKIFL